MKLEKCKGVDNPILPILLLAVMAPAWSEAGTLVIYQVWTCFPNLTPLDQHFITNFHLLAALLASWAIGLNVALMEWNKMKKINSLKSTLSHLTENLGIKTPPKVS